MDKSLWGVNYRNPQPLKHTKHWEFPIIIVSKIIPTADFGYQRLKSLMIDIQYDETSLISCDNHFMSITNTYVTRLNSPKI